MLDYVYDVASADCPPSRLHAIAAALWVVEKRGGVSPGDMICEQALWKQTMRQMVMEWQQSRGMSVLKAPGFTIKMLISSELFTVSAGPAFFRLVALTKLLKIWGCLRYSDVQGIRPAAIMFTQEGLRLTLERSKTSGPGKKTGHIFIFINRLAGFSGVDWQSAGMDLLKSDEFNFSRDYLLPVMGPTEDSARHRLADYAAASGYSKAVLRLLRNVVRVQRKWVALAGPLIDECLINHWSEHSERHFMPQALAAFLVEKNLRDKIGRWGMNQSHQSDD